MTTKLELENNINDKREKIILLELADNAGVHKTEYGNVDLQFIETKTLYGTHTDIVFDFKKAKSLINQTKSVKRRISIGEKNGRGSQQIGREVTLFVSTARQK